MSALLFIDIESTGFSKDHSALIEIGAIAVIDGEVVGEVEYKIKPHEDAIIDPGALKVNGYKYEQIMQWDDLKDTIDKFVTWVDSHERKFALAGHNIAFDSGFLFKAFCRTGSYGDHCTRFKSKSIDTLAMAKEIGKKKIKCENFKLGTLCEFFEIPLVNAHTALADIKATYQLYLKLETMMPKVLANEFIGTYQQKRAKFLDSKYIMRNHDGSVYLSPEWAKDKQAREFILQELWDLENE